MAGAHMLAGNAGIYVIAPLAETTLEQWDVAGGHRRSEGEPAAGSLVAGGGREAGQRLGELARQVHTGATDAKRLADQLERAGLMSSASDPGHRQRRVLRPTANGGAVAGELARRAAAQDRRIASLLGPSRLAQLQSLRDRFESVLAADPPPGSGQGRG
ncbi:MAG: hypothetical protein ACM32E_23220 [Gemmatimonadota bacterium]